MFVRLKQFAPKCRGVLTLRPTDAVIVVKGDRETFVGWLPHYDGARLRFTRYLDHELCKAIHRACCEVRYANGKPPISELYNRPPNPQAIRAAMSGQRRTKKKTTSQIILPEGFNRE